jgi:hypothetical protein
MSFHISIHLYIYIADFYCYYYYFYYYYYHYYHHFQPWVPTKAFPHPLSGMRYTRTEWSSANYLSYQTVDGLLWQSFLPYINSFRVHTLKLEPIRFLERTWDVINYHKVGCDMHTPQLSNGHGTAIALASHCHFST